MAQKYGYMANGVGAPTKPCLICDEPAPRYSWTDAHGEGYCVTCGTPYQLMNGTLDEGETYPRINIADKFIPLLQRYWREEHRGNGLGSFFIPQDYPDQIEDRRVFEAWHQSVRT